MAINNQNTFAPPGTAGTAKEETHFDSFKTESSWSFASLASGTEVSRNSVSEVLTNSYTAFNKLLEQTALPKHISLKIEKIDNQQFNSLKLSSLLFVALNQQTKTIAYHTLLLEGSSEQIQAKTEQWQGQTVKIDRSAADVYDQTYSSIIDGYIESVSGSNKVKSASASVLYRFIKLDDLTKIEPICKNAVLACLNVLDTRPDTNLGHLDKTEQLQAQISFNENFLVDYTGLPYKSDLKVELIASKSSTNNAVTLNTPNNNLVLSRLSGYIDFNYTGRDYRAVNSLTQPCFAPNLIITSLENLLRLSVGQQLLALTSALALVSEETAWYPAFMHRPSSKNEVNLRDIGALNIEADIFTPIPQRQNDRFGAMVDTQSAEFNNYELGHLIRNSCHPGMSISIDVSRCGPDTFYNGFLVDAALGNQDAIRAIIAGGNTLTNGNLTKFYDVNRDGPPVLQQVSTVLYGYYVDSQGVQRDIREFDNYLAIANLCKNNPKDIVAYSDTYFRTEYPEAVRLQARKNILNNLIGTGINFTQTGFRITINPAFLTAISAALNGLGINIRTLNPSSHSDYSNQRGIGNWVLPSTMSYGNTRLFHQNTPGTTFGNTSSNFHSGHNWM